MRRSVPHFGCANAAGSGRCRGFSDRRPVARPCCTVEECVLQCQQHVLPGRLQPLVAATRWLDQAS